MLHLDFAAPVKLFPLLLLAELPYAESVDLELEEVVVILEVFTLLELFFVALDFRGEEMASPSLLPILE